jgi:hypothetical protein
LVIYDFLPKLVKCSFKLALIQLSIAALVSSFEDALKRADGDTLLLLKEYLIAGLNALDLDF